MAVGWDSRLWTANLLLTETAPSSSLVLTPLLKEGPLVLIGAPVLKLMPLMLPLADAPRMEVAKPLVE